MAKYILALVKHNHKAHAYVRLVGTNKCWYTFHPKNAFSLANKWHRGIEDDLFVFEDSDHIYDRFGVSSWCKIKHRLKELGYTLTTPPEATR